MRINLEQFTEQNKNSLAATGILIAISAFWVSIQPHTKFMLAIVILCIAATLPLVWSVVRSYANADTDLGTLVFVMLFAAIWFLSSLYFFSVSLRYVTTIGKLLILAAPPVIQIVFMKTRAPSFLARRLGDYSNKADIRTNEWRTDRERKSLSVTNYGEHRRELHDRDVKRQEFNKKVEEGRRGTIIYFESLVNICSFILFYATAIAIYLRIS